MFNKLFALVLTTISFNTLANWQLQNELSNLSFVSIKNNVIGEVHHFKSLKGNINKQGMLSFSTDLTSVETLIPIRNERMKSILFNTKMFPELTLKADINNQLNTLETGIPKIVSVTATLSLHGITKTLPLQVLALKGKDGSLTASAMQPVIINANDFNLADGLETLRKVAGLSSIAQSIPVSFVLHFKKSS
jgi:polyisoprenoid-binding protein YceI